jgi:predicted nucleic acid-binding protein
MPGSFLDSNVILYFAARDGQKADRAESLMRSGGMISVQVLNEIASVGRGKMKLAWEEVARALELVRRLLRVRPLTVDTHDAGLVLARRYRLAIYDAMILAAALESDCDTLWSEDMQHGLVVDGRLTVRNPFNL